MRRYLQPYVTGHGEILVFRNRRTLRRSSVRNRYSGKLLTESFVTVKSVPVQRKGLTDCRSITDFALMFKGRRSGVKPCWNSPVGGSLVSTLTSSGDTSNVKTSCRGKWDINKGREGKVPPPRVSVQDYLKDVWAEVQELLGRMLCHKKLGNLQSHIQTLGVIFFFYLFCLKYTSWFSVTPKRSFVPQSLRILNNPYCGHFSFSLSLFVLTRLPRWSVVSPFCFRDGRVTSRVSFRVGNLLRTWSTHLWTWP